MAENNNNPQDLQAHFKPVPIPDPNTGIDKQNDIAKLVAEDEGLANAVDLSVINSFRTISENREKQYQIYDEMGKDTIISSALELYADNATEYNSKGRVIWVESDDKDLGSTIATICNRLIDQFNLNETAWADIYALVKYGDIYLETFRKSELDEERIGKQNLINNSSEKTLNESINSKKASIVEDVIVNYYDDNDQLSEYIERYTNPAELFELTKRGKTVGFLRTKIPEDMLKKNESKTTVPSPAYTFDFNSNDIQLYDPTKFVHIYLPNPSNRYKEEVKLFREGTIKTKSNSKKANMQMQEAYTYGVKRGKSILYDIYKIYREKSLLEDSILLNRVSRSALVRIVQVEVGDMGKPQVQQLLQRIKALFEQKTALYTGQSMTEYTNSGPVENNVYIPTREGKGGLTLNNLGGDVNVGDLTDLDYYNNKEFAGLKIPKPFLGFMDDNAGFSGGESLTKVSSSFAKTIKRVQNAYLQGIKTLINIFLLDRGMTSYVNKFEVRMVSPSTIEDNERNETLNTTTDIVNNIMGLFGDVENNKSRLELLLIMLKEKLNIPDLIDKLEEIIENMPDDDVDDADDDRPTGELGSAMNNVEREIGDRMGGSGGPPPDLGDTNTTDTEPTDTDEDDVLPSPRELGIDLADNDAVNAELGEE